MKQGCYMASIDVQDACYTIPVSQENRTFMRFSWGSQMNEYTCLPNYQMVWPQHHVFLAKL